MLVIVLAHGVSGLLQGLLGLFMDSLHPMTVYFGGGVFDIRIGWPYGSRVVTIVGVKGCHFGGRGGGVVVGELCQGEELVPVVLVVIHKRP